MICFLKSRIDRTLVIRSNAADKPVKAETMPTQVLPPSP